MLTPERAVVVLTAEDRLWRSIHEDAIDLALEDARGANGHAEMLAARTWLFDPKSRFSTLHCRLLGLDPERARLMARRRLAAQRPPRSRGRSLGAADDESPAGYVAPAISRRPVSLESRAKMRAAALGRRHTRGAIEKIRAARCAQSAKQEQVRREKKGGVTGQD